MTRGATSGLLALVLLIAGGVGAWYFMSPGRAPDTISASVGGMRLVVPAAYMRRESAAAPGHLELAASYPDFQPAGRLTRDGKAPEPPALGENRIVLTLAPEDGQMAPQDRPARLYARFLEREVWTHGGGLVMRRFEARTPYEKEDLYLTPPEGRAFYARCMRPEPGVRALPDTCISETRVGSIDVQIRFSPALLADWERLSEGARGLVQKMVR